MRRTATITWHRAAPSLKRLSQTPRGCRHEKEEQKLMAATALPQAPYEARQAAAQFRSYRTLPAGLRDSPALIEKSQEISPWDRGSVSGLISASPWRTASFNCGRTPIRGSRSGLITTTAASLITSICVNPGVPPQSATITSWTLALPTLPSRPRPTIRCAGFRASQPDSLARAGFQTAHARPDVFRRVLRNAEDEVR